MSEKRFFTYKGYPLVRLGDQLYYGNMYDNYVVWMQILSKEKKGDLEVASKVKMYKDGYRPQLASHEGYREAERTSYAVQCAGYGLRLARQAERMIIG